MNAIDLIHWTEEKKENNDLDAGNLGLEKDVGNCGSEKRLAKISVKSTIAGKFTGS